MAVGSGKDLLYIGFQKEDYDRSAGRMGRFITDDSRKYPGKEDAGFLTGATGGFAGGEHFLS